ncbi:MAG: DMT family transporter [Treponema sp.]|nr:DMT family transporter [Treponema sp.]
MKTPVHAARSIELWLLLLANMVGASSALLIKASTIHPILQASYRQLFAGILLLPLFFRELKRSGLRFSPRLILPSVLPGLTLGLHFIAWIFGARMTLAGNATVITTMVPVAMPFLVYFMTKELPRGAEVAGTILAMAGIVILGIFDFRLEPAHFGGDIVCFVSMLFYAAYLALARRFAPKEGILLYLVPLYLIGGTFDLLLSLPFANPIRGITATDLVMTLGLALGPTIVGHSLMNRAMTRLSPQTVSLFNLTQFLVAAVLAYFLFGEMPTLAFGVASLLIVIGVAIPVLARSPA